MDIVVKGRRTDVPERFRQRAVEKLTKLHKLDGKVITLDVEVSKERNRRQSHHKDRIEITCRSRGPVIRAEASADDLYAALDLAYAKMEMRLRRAADRRRIHRGRHTPVSVAEATAPLAETNGTEMPAANSPPAAEQDVAEGAGAEDPAPSVEVHGGEGPMVVREKVHYAQPMTLDQALYEMELVGHDFYLFVDAHSRLPSVVYRRKGYDYGVIRVNAGL